MTTRELARFAADLQFEDLPERVVKIAKRQVLGLLGAVFAGARTGGVQAIARALGRAQPAAGDAPSLASPPATAPPLAPTTTLQDAVYLHACASIAHHPDDSVVFRDTGH